MRLIFWALDDEVRVHRQLQLPARVSSWGSQWKRMQHVLISANKGGVWLFSLSIVPRRPWRREVLASAPPLSHGRQNRNIGTWAGRWRSDGSIECHTRCLLLFTGRMGDMDTSVFPHRLSIFPPDCPLFFINYCSLMMLRLLLDQTGHLFIVGIKWFQTCDSLWFLSECFTIQIYKYNMIKEERRGGERKGEERRKEEDERREEEEGRRGEKRGGGGEEGRRTGIVSQ